MVGPILIILHILFVSPLALVKPMRVDRLPARLVSSPVGRSHAGRSMALS